jgi:hypothetical protein
VLGQRQMQRRSVKEALRATFSGRQGLGYTPPALEPLRGAFLCVSCPSRHQEHSLPADYPQHVPDPADVVRTVWSAARGEGMSHRLPCSGAHIGAQNLGAFSRTGGNATKTDIAMQHCREFVGLRTGCGRYVSLSRDTATQKSMLYTSVSCVSKFALAQES